jgi:hypothetical protein
VHVVETHELLSGLDIGVLALVLDLIKDLLIREDLHHIIGR